MGKHARKKQKPGAKVVITAAAVTGLTIGGVTTASAATMAHWDTIAQCESSGNWSIDHGDGGDGSPGSGASAWGGGLQFQPASWNAAIAYLNSRGIDTSHFGIHASNSTKDQQILAAEALLHIQPGHPDPWACDPNQILGPSMFDGGANPWGLPGAQIPASVLGGGTPAPPPTPVPVPTPTPGGGSHGRWWHHWMVAKGDTLYGIAKHAYGDGRQYPRIAHANGIKAPYVIHPGQRLYVP